MLAALAISSCGGDSVRTQTAFGLNVSSDAKAAVTEYYAEHRNFPTDNREAGIPPPHEIIGKYITQVAVDHGQITVTFGNDAHKRIQGKALVLELDTSDDPKLTWKCYSPDIEDRDLIHACKSQQHD